MSVEAFVWVMDNSPSRLAERLVMYSIADHSNPQGENAYPSIARMAKEQNLSRRQVQRCLKNLIGRGEIFLAPREEGNTPMYVIRGIQRPHCFYCGSELFSWLITQDHKIPRSRGGTNAPDNLVNCCASCNSSKHTKTLEEFREYKKVDRFPGEGGSTHPNLFEVSDRMSYWYDKSDMETTKMSPEPSINQKQEPPLPPASGGEESSFEWCRERIAVRMGRRKRLPNLNWAAGVRAGDVAEFLTRKGFPARVMT